MYSSSYVNSFAHTFETTKMFAFHVLSHIVRCVFVMMANSFLTSANICRWFLSLAEHASRVSIDRKELFFGYTQAVFGLKIFPLNEVELGCPIFARNSDVSLNEPNF